MILTAWLTVFIWCIMMCIRNYCIITECIPTNQTNELSEPDWLKRLKNEVIAFLPQFVESEPSLFCVSCPFYVVLHLLCLSNPKFVLEAPGWNKQFCYSGSGVRFIQDIYWLVLITSLSGFLFFFFTSVSIISSAQTSLESELNFFLLEEFDCDFTYSSLAITECITTNKTIMCVNSRH